MLYFIGGAFGIIIFLLTSPQGLGRMDVQWGFFVYFIILGELCIGLTNYLLKKMVSVQSCVFRWWVHDLINDS